jgi:CheY-like chemotaxis protein
MTDAHMPEMDGFALIERVREDPELARTTVIVMLSSGDQRLDAARCRELGVAVYLMKPIRRMELLTAVITALNPSPATATLPAEPIRPEPKEAGAGRRILVVEDNPVNQVLARRLLAKRGHRVTTAANGREAMLVLGEQSFDLILMDVQMPEMDGFETTSAIRERERATGVSRADHCHDRPRHEGRRGAMPAGRNGRLRHQANPPG